MFAVKQAYQSLHFIEGPVKLSTALENLNMCIHVHVRSIAATLNHIHLASFCGT